MPMTPNEQTCIASSERSALELTEECITSSCSVPLGDICAVAATDSLNAVCLFNLNPISGCLVLAHQESEGEQASKRASEQARVSAREQGGGRGR
eukprot:2470150-Pleurochrysis_carterae.AAC.1